MQHAYRGEYDMEVELTLFTPEEGGSRTGLPAQSDFDGPRISIDGNEWHALFTLQDREWLNPGETAHVFVTLGFPHYVLGKLYPDQPFLLHEGYHPIGKGRVLWLLNSEKHAEEAMQREKERCARLSEQVPPGTWERTTVAQKHIEMYGFCC